MSLFSIVSMSQIESEVNRLNDEGYTVEKSQQQEDNIKIFYRKAQKLSFRSISFTFKKTAKKTHFISRIFSRISQKIC